MGYGKPAYDKSSRSNRVFTQDEMKGRAAPSRKNCGILFYRLTDMRFMPPGSVSLEYNRDSLHRLKYVGLVAVTDKDDDRFHEYVTRNGQRCGVMRTPELVRELMTAGVLPSEHSVEYGDGCVFIDKPYELSEIKRPSAKNLSRLPLSPDYERLAVVAEHLTTTGRGNWIYVGEGHWRDPDGVECYIA